MLCMILNRRSHIDSVVIGAIQILNKALLLILLLKSIIACKWHSDSIIDCVTTQLLTPTGDIAAIGTRPCSTACYITRDFYNETVTMGCADTQSASSLCPIMNACYAANDEKQASDTMFADC